MQTPELVKAAPQTWTIQIIIDHLDTEYISCCICLAFLLHCFLPSCASGLSWPKLRKLSHVTWMQTKAAPPAEQVAPCVNDWCAKSWAETERSMCLVAEAGWSGLLWSVSSLLPPHSAAVITDDVLLLAEAFALYRYLNLELTPWVSSVRPADRRCSDVWITDVQECSAQHRLSVCSHCFSLACDSGCCLEKSSESYLSLCQVCVSFGFCPEKSQ